MPLQEMNDYISNNLSNDVALYLNRKVQNFHNVAQYYSPSGYFNEYTVQAVAFQCINAWITANENINHYLVRTEVAYGGFANRADIMITYDTGNGAHNIALEFKANFSAASVNEDVDLLDAIRGVQNPPIDDGYACYIIRFGHGGWADQIDEPLQDGVALVPILVD
ncbi:hypothetical protein [Kordiimonas sp.]|uniref:hypothetical protein n=1 Tax=Kordiimonas sp. TaxID=1970157 RepID=UPI003A947D3C